VFGATSTAFHSFRRIGNVVSGGHDERVLVLCRFVEVEDPARNSMGCVYGLVYSPNSSLPATGPTRKQMRYYGIKVIFIISSHLNTIYVK